MQDAHAQYSFMVVPRVFKELTAKRVLTMEWMVGENPTKLLSITKELPSNNTSHYIDERKQLEARAHLLDLVFVGLDLYKLSDN
jgi:aarF domain-containing kinase